MTHRFTQYRRSHTHSVGVVLLGLLSLIAHPSMAREGSASVFTIPDANPGNGLYRPDIQSSYPAVDWNTLDVLCLPAAQYKFINLGNLPQRDANRPLTITNCGGQVRVGGLDHHYLFILNGGSNWRLTGEYSIDAQTGHPDFTGHADGQYADTHGRYGILIDDGTTEEGNPSGLGIGGGATDFELDFIEVTRVGFAGMLIKTDNNASAVMANVRIHDTFIHDVGSEGMYIGSTQSQPQHLFVNLQIYNNRIVRAGTESFQLGQIGNNTQVYNNVFVMGAADWKHPFQSFQDHSTQLNPRTGNFSFRNNIVIGGGSNWINFLGSVIPGDPHLPTDLIEVRNNYFSHSRRFGAYIGRFQDGVSTLRVADNWFSDIQFQYDQIDVSATDYNQFFRIGSGSSGMNTIAIEFIDNRYDGSQFFISNWPDPNIQNGTVSGVGNSQTAVPDLVFVDSGFDSDFDYFRFEVWTPDDINDGAVQYQTDDLVSVNGQLYLCVDPSGCASGLAPTSNPQLWQAQPQPADDWRLATGSPIQGVGLLDNPLMSQIFEDGFEQGN